MNNRLSPESKAEIETTLTSLATRNKLVSDIDHFAMKLDNLLREHTIKGTLPGLDNEDSIVEEIASRTMVFYASLTLRMWPGRYFPPNQAVRDTIPGRIVEEWVWTLKKLISKHDKQTKIDVLREELPWLSLSEALTSEKMAGKGSQHLLRSTSLSSLKMAGEGPKALHRSKSF